MTSTKVNIHKFNGETFSVGDAVIYSVYPMVEDGTANVTATGIVATGATARGLYHQGVSLNLAWEFLFYVRHAVKDDPNYEAQALQEIANGIGGEVWHSGGGIQGVSVQCDQHEVFFAFSDGVLGWDIREIPEWEYIGSGTTDLAIDQTDLIIARCQGVLCSIGK